MSKPLFMIFSLFIWSSLATAQVRKVAIKTDDILTVKTALGIATIIQLPETIQSAIIGDQSGFKVEYLDKAVTIKPLRFGVKTNLYLVTEKQRYNIRLVTLAQTSADYIVYVKNPDQTLKTNKWVSVGSSQKAEGTRLSIERVGFSEAGFILIDAKLTAVSSQSLSLSPDDIEIKQNGRSRVINGLFLSALKASRGDSILIGVSLAKSDLIPKKSISLEWKSRKPLSVVLPESLLWK